MKHLNDVYILGKVVEERVAIVDLVHLLQLDIGFDIDWLLAQLGDIHPENDVNSCQWEVENIGIINAQGARAVFKYLALSFLVSNRVI